MLTDQDSHLVVIEAQVSAGTATVVIRGDLDLTGGAMISGRLADILDKQPERLVFDMARLGFIDCAAARMIAGAGQFLPLGQRPVLRSPQPVVRRVLELTGLDGRFEVEEQPVAG